MRLPHFRYLAPGDLAEAARMLAGEGPQAMLVAGGTDVLPNMKRRQQVPATLIGLRGLPELRRVQNGDGLRLGAGLTLFIVALIVVPVWIRSRRGSRTESAG